MSNQTAIVSSLRTRFRISSIAPNCSSSGSSTLRADSNIGVQDYHVWVDGTAYTIRQSDLLVAEFGHNMRKSEEGQEIGRAVAARERPDEAEVGLRLDLEPEPRKPPTELGRCARCGGQVVSRISFPGDPPERRCVQCGRSEVPPRVLTPDEQKPHRSAAGHRPCLASSRRTP